jgi:hypothetical protein
MNIYIGAAHLPFIQFLPLSSTLTGICRMLFCKDKIRRGWIGARRKNEESDGKVIPFF